MKTIVRMTWHFLIIAITATWTWSGAADTKTPQVPPPSGIKVGVHVDPKVATVGDPIRVDLDIHLPAGHLAAVTPNNLPPDKMSFLEFEPGPSPPKSSKPGGPDQQGARAEPEPHRARAVIAIYRTGEFKVSPFRITIKTPDGLETTVPLPEVDIRIRSILPEKEATLKGLKKQAEIPDPGRWIRRAAWVVAACLLLLIAYYLWLKRKWTPTAPASAAQSPGLLESAERDLRDLLTRGVSRGDEKQYYVQLSDVVKRILGAGYGIHTAERTTSEIMESMNGSPFAGPDDRAKVQSFLRRCDLVKFAKYTPSDDEHADAAEEALSILGLAKEALERRRPSAVSLNGGAGPSILASKDP